VLCVKGFAAVLAELCESLYCSSICPGNFPTVFLPSWRHLFQLYSLGEMLGSGVGRARAPLPLTFKKRIDGYPQ
jgi:hypothetical protein